MPHVRHFFVIAIKQINITVIKILICHLRGFSYETTHHFGVF